MPRYYFDVTSNDELVIDDTGTEFPDVTQAHREAIRTLAEISAELIPLNGPRRLTIEVRDQSRKSVLKTQVSFDPGHLSDEAEQSVGTRSQ